jgi:hypothetical protein
MKSGRTDDDPFAEDSTDDQPDETDESARESDAVLDADDEPDGDADAGSDRVDDLADALEERSGTATISARSEREGGVVELLVALDDADDLDALGAPLDEALDRDRQADYSVSGVVRDLLRVGVDDVAADVLDEYRDARAEVARRSI